MVVDLIIKKFKWNNSNNIYVEIYIPFNVYI
jgi:hypothetical protein